MKLFAYRHTVMCEMPDDVQNILWKMAGNTPIFRGIVPCWSSSWKQKKKKYFKPWQVILATSVQPIWLGPTSPWAMSWLKAWTHGSQAGAERKCVRVHVYSENTTPTAVFKTGNSAILKNSWHLPYFSKVPKDLQLLVSKQLKNI